jgi:hypothetical protein
MSLCNYKGTHYLHFFNAFVTATKRIHMHLSKQKDEG